MDSFIQKYSSRKSSETRISIATIMSSIIHLVYLSGNFALSTAVIHECSHLNKFVFIGKYSMSALFLSLPYFTINEVIVTLLKQRKIENYFLAYSLSSIVVMPFFTFVQYAFRGFSCSSRPSRRPIPPR